MSQPSSYYHDLLCNLIPIVEMSISDKIFGCAPSCIRVDSSVLVALPVAQNDIDVVYAAIGMGWQCRLTIDIESS